MGSLQLLQAPAKYLQLLIENVDDAKFEKNQTEIQERYSLKTSAILQLIMNIGFLSL